MTPGKIRSAIKRAERGRTVHAFRAANPHNGYSNTWCRLALDPALDGIKFTSDGSKVTCIVCQREATAAIKERLST